MKFCTVMHVDLSYPLRSIAPSLDSAVLGVLAGTESALSAMQIARLAAKGTRGGQRHVLDRLVEHGLVMATPANRGFLYRLNREHVLAPAILSAANARSEVLQRLIAAVAALDPRPVHVSVYGSFARGEAGPSSDIDMLIILESGSAADDQWAAQVQSLSERVLTWTGNRLEPFVVVRADLQGYVQRKEPIIGSWVNDSHTLLGGPIHALIAQAEPDERVSVDA